MSVTTTQPGSPQYIPHLHDVINHVKNYIDPIIDQALSKTIPQQIHYWSSKVSEHIQHCLDVLLPEYNNWTNLTLIRWLTTGNTLFQLTKIWKENKANIKSHELITQWLPYIVQKHLPPHLLPQCSYGQLRKYCRMWENRELITKLPEIRGEHTHRLNEMNRWIREFQKNVKIMATQRNIAVPDDIDKQIDLYHVYLAHHSKPMPSDDENDDCPMLDSLSNGIDGDDEDDDESANEDEKNTQEMSEDESVQLEPVKKKDKYKRKYKQLKKDYLELKRELKKTQVLHCQECRKRYVYEQLQREHKDEIDALNATIKVKNIELQDLSEAFKLLQTAIDFARSELRKRISTMPMIMNNGSIYKDGYSSISSNGTDTERSMLSISDNSIGIADNNNCYNDYKSKRKPKKRKFSESVASRSNMNSQEKSMKPKKKKNKKK